MIYATVVFPIAVFRYSINCTKTVSTWGGRATLSFNELYAQWQKNSLLDLSTVPGMIYFDAK